MDSVNRILFSLNYFMTFLYHIDMIKIVYLVPDWMNFPGPQNQQTVTSIFNL